MAMNTSDWPYRKGRWITFNFFFLLSKQLYDWLTVNKFLVKELLKSHDDKSNGSLGTDDFVSCLYGIGAPLDETSKTKLLAVYDKKGEGKINYIDLLSDHKYIHAVCKYHH